MSINDLFDKLNEEKLSRRTVLKVGAAVGVGMAGLGVAGCTSPSPTVTPTSTPLKVKDTVNIGYLITDHDSPFYIAATKIDGAQSYLEKYGMNINITNFSSGPEILTQIAGGKIDIGIAGVPPVILAYDKDPTVRIVTSVHKNGSGLFVKKGSGLAKFTDLKGKKVGTPGPGSIQDILVRELCKSNNLVYGTDVDAVKLPQGQWIGAVDAGTVDAVMGWEPFVTMAEMQGIGETILRSEDILPGHPCDSIVTTKGMIEQYPDSIKAFLRAHRDAVELIKNDPQKAAQIVSSKEWMNNEPAVERASMEHITFLYKPDEEYLAGFDRFSKVLKEELSLTKKVYTRDEIFDLSLVNGI
ncbi:putative ABC transporter substrate binding protein [Methanocella paludicola SANAE]|uniref:ABC transporter substrate binding protein n=1 Tax=Methanocella paludicola (strain DSM 17711 / JCM 13418 / NBRC 101707 / SANAE) TaxID=304371 RepID=D1Z1M1_METPS|nr:ABC transporter substrate-binding protein [Methanocella paludicola]BAI62593.1 putative ABC transporter substrate binding protein [Methanocella paludicola SANAE]